MRIQLNRDTRTVEIDGEQFVGAFRLLEAQDRINELINDMVAEVPRVELDLDHVKIDLYSNEEQSTCRLTHLPTGIVVTADEYGSNLRNQELAFDRLIEALTIHQEKTDDEH